MNRFATLLFGVCLTATAAMAQTSVDPNTPGALNEAVNSNTTDGAVFVLQQGQTYLLTDRMEPTVSLEIRADGGNCPTVEADCPLIQPLDQGGSVERVLQIETANVEATLSRVAVTNISSAGTSDGRTIRLQADGVKLRIDSSLVYGEPSMAIRVDNAAPSIFLTHSVFRQIGDSDGSLDDGRVIDDRGNDIDSLVVVDNTFYSINNRIIRDDGGDLGFFRFESNTVHLLGRRVTDEQDITGDVIVQNNLLIDSGIEGSEDDGDPATDDADAQIRIGTVGGEATITNNSFVFDDGQLLDASSRPVGPELYNENAASLATNTFDFRPAFVSAQPAFFDFSGVPYSYDYPSTETAFTSATDGGMLGSRIWTDGAIVETEGGPEMLTFALRAYPNPLVREGTIAFELAAPARVTLEVFDALGRRVETLAADSYAAGPHEAALATASFQPGIYLVRLTADGTTATLPITVVR